MLPIAISRGGPHPETRVTATKINASYDRRSSSHGRVYSYWYINYVVSMLFDTCTGQIHTNSILPVLRFWGSSIKIVFLDDGCTYPHFPNLPTITQLLPSSGIAIHHKHSGTHNNSSLSCSFSMSIWSVVAPRVVAHANRSTSPEGKLNSSCYLLGGGLEIKSVHKPILQFYPHFTEKVWPYIFLQHLATKGQNLW